LKRLAAAQRQVDALMPSLLARAFRGQLISRDPTDEPATILLERINTNHDRKSHGAARKQPSDSSLGNRAKTEQVPSGTEEPVLVAARFLSPPRGSGVIAFATHR
jgi:hypothetical protein